MKTFERVGLLILISILFSPSVVNATGIAVVDALARTESIKQWTEKLQQWKQTTEQYKFELKAYQDQLATSIGLRQIGDFVKDAKRLKQDLHNLQKQGLDLNVLLMSEGAMSSDLNRIYNKYSLFDSCNAEQSKGYSEVCKQIVVNKALAVEQSADIQKKISAKLNDIARLSSRIENATDTKDSLDLSNAISLKTTQLNALSTQWEMSVKQAEMRDQLLEKKREKAFRAQQLNAPIADLN